MRTTCGFCAARLAELEAPGYLGDSFCNDGGSPSPVGEPGITAPDLREERHELVHEVVLRAGGVGVVVGVRLVAVEQRQVRLRDVRLVGEDRCGVQDPLPSERGAEGAYPKIPRQVVAMRRSDVEDALRRVGVPRGHRPGVDRQALGVVPGGAVQALQPRPGEHLRITLDRGALTGLVPATWIAAR